MTAMAVQKVKDALEKQDAKPPVNNIRTLLEKMKPEIEKALPSHLSPERMVRIANTCLGQNPKLAQCEPISFIAAVIQASQLGLEPNIDGQCYIIPYNNSVKTANGWEKKMMAQFQIGYKGLVDLFWRHEKSQGLLWGVVKQKDVDDGRFTFDLGTGQIHHAPDIFAEDRGPSVAYWIIIQIKGGGVIPKVMSLQEVTKHAKAHSKTWDSRSSTFYDDSPWTKDFDAMALKTVLIQAMKLAPKSIEMQHALAADETTKTRFGKDMLAIPDETDWSQDKKLESAEAKQIPAEAPTDRLGE